MVKPLSFQLCQDGEKFVKNTLSNLSVNTSAEDAVKTSDLVIEAIIENIDVKKKLFTALDVAAPE